MHDGGPAPRNETDRLTRFLHIFLTVIFTLGAITQFANGRMYACLGEIFLILMIVCFVRERKFEVAGDKQFGSLYLFTGIALGIIGNCLVLFS